MTSRRLIAFDLGGTLEQSGRSLYPDLRPAFDVYAHHHPDTRFGIATNGEPETAYRFVDEEGIGQHFIDPTNGESLILSPGMRVITTTSRREPTPANFIERLRGKTSGSIEVQVDTDHMLYPKPRPDIINHLMYITGVEPRNTVFVGDDQYSDKACAEAAGVQFVSCDPLSGQRPETATELLLMAHDALPPID